MEWGFQEVAITNSILAFGIGAEAVYCDQMPTTLSCCDIYGNEGGDWVGYIAGQYGVTGNISADPLFCDPGGGDLMLDCSSPCAPFSPPNPECDLIGAWEVGCGGTPEFEVTWGGLKHLFQK